MRFHGERGFVLRDCMDLYAGERWGCKRLEDAPVQSETQRSRVENGWSYPIDANPAGGRAGDTALTIEERDDAEECGADSHESDLKIISILIQKMMRGDISIWRYDGWMDERTS
jgi:hypothetical protein